MPLQGISVTLEPLSLAISVNQKDSTDCWHLEQRRISPNYWISLAVRRPRDVAILADWQVVRSVSIVSEIRRFRRRPTEIR